MKTGKMRKAMTVFTAALLSAVSVLGVGCAPKPEARSDINYFYIGTYGGGYGKSWLDELAREFEAKYADYSFEPGKKGVKIDVDANKATMTGPMLLNSIENQRATLFFTQDFNYYDYLSKGLLEDISDCVTEPLSDYGESKAISDKMSGNYKDYFAVDGKYYAIPFSDTFVGIVYDVDLFQNKKLYMKKGGGWTDDLSLATYGPDGKTGVIDGIDYSIDDGLPATYDEFIALMKQMVKFSIQPMHFTGKYIHYTSMMMLQLWAANLQRSDIELFYSLNGSTDSLCTVNNGAVSMLPTTAITEENGYDIYKQESRYQVLKFVQDLVSDKQLLNQRSFDDITHTEAQEDFILNKYNSKNDIAMLVEGTWWFNEAKDIFDDIENEKGEEAGVYGRNYAFMPMPRASADITGQNKILYDGGKTACFVSKSKDEVSKNIAREFIKFAHTDKALQRFTVETSMTRSFEYDMPEDMLSQMTPTGRNYYNLIRNSDVIVGIYNNDIYINNSGNFKIANFWCSNGMGTLTDPFSAFWKKSGLTAETYFNGMSSYWKNKWGGLKR